MRLSSLTLVMGLIFGLLPHAAAAADLFADGQGSADFAIFPGWTRVVAEYRKEAAEEAQPQKAKTPCANPQDCRLREWTSFLRTTAKLGRDQQLDAVNKWINTRPYTEDWANWGLPDYWETPAEFLTRGGDCEDYAIVKYFSLVALGFAPDDLRILVVRDTNLEIFHAVLAVHERGNTLLLDNQIAQPVPVALASHYSPIYSLNERGWWLAAQPQVAANQPGLTQIFASAGK
ncbi:MAG: transglutaminase-like cysteine peptidase [Parvibaculum sp.]|uniref:transglutaminase-like cysteine peptidase n=1 Tax=Parvibaculum sp. TaxID=2024848 RepID=UPI0025D69E59|nr:transglutaminase-like cysteine peptidase [Parvibaculum sp.]MCE9650793.1 transglutaminase-like cysteine peptidase [Parvibaculum sp.]